MGRFVVRRAIQAVLVLIGITTLLFFLLRLSGDPAALLVGENATPEQIEAVRRSLGLDQPLPVQYFRYMAGVAQFDFGDSLVTKRDALTMVWEAFPSTLVLAISSLIVGMIVAVPVGIYAALKRGSFASFLAMLIALLGQSMPSFWMGIMLILIFAVQLRWLPSFGSGTLLHIILPTITLSSFIMARHARLIRSGMLEVLGQDYIRTANAKGAPPRLVILRHALKNTLIPVVTVLAVDLSFLVGGSVVIETVFAWPGMGRQMVQAVSGRDYPVVQATVFIVALLVVVINLAVDVIYSYLDPRIKVE